jgi:hypothetical protein
VPAPAVIPAPVMYLEVAAVKTLVVETGLGLGSWGGRGAASAAPSQPPDLVPPQPLATKRGEIEFDPCAWGPRL